MEHREDHNEIPEFTLEDILAEFGSGSDLYRTEDLPKNPLKCEYFLPTVASELIDEGKAAVTVLKSTDKWYGVTYREDKPTVVAAIAQKTQEGLYPEDLWA